MTLSPELVEQVRQRANLACEYCGVSEMDSGGLLTVDHFRPRTHDGGDDLENLLYCCYRCNLYKGDYWPGLAGETTLWNPRKEPMQTHLDSLADGRLYPLTPIGELTIRRLRLNRPQLVKRRLHLRVETEKMRSAAEKKLFLALLVQMYGIQVDMHEAQGVLLREQARILKQFLQNDS